MKHDDNQKRINPAIELLEQGQPVYWKYAIDAGHGVLNDEQPGRGINIVYTGSHGGTAASFEQGRKDSQTWADYIHYDMESAPFDVAGLAAYMQGLVAGGPTPSGHRMPTVMVGLPVRGTDEATVRANSWMFEQVLATGVQSIILAHTITAGAVRAFVEAVRFPEHRQGVGPGLLPEGRRGAHGTLTAANIWGVSAHEYREKADVWPLNPKGELLLCVKIEDKYGLANVEEIVKVPGIGSGEGGGFDMMYSLGVPWGAPEAREASARIFAAAKAQNLYWHGIGGVSQSEEEVAQTIREGRMIGFNKEVAEIGRKITGRVPQ